METHCYIIYFSSYPWLEEKLAVAVTFFQEDKHIAFINLNREDLIEQLYGKPARSVVESSMRLLSRDHMDWSVSPHILVGQMLRLPERMTPEKYVTVLLGR